MKNLINFCLFISIGITLASCGSSLKVSTDYDKQAEFSSYKTFSFYVFSDKGPGISELNRNRIVNAVKAEMIKKGFTENDNSPDVLVNVTTILKEKKQVSASTNYYGYGGYYRPYYWSPGYTGSTTYNVQEYKDGSLIIDVVDAATKKLVWQGTGNKQIDAPLKNPDTEIPDAVKKIMAGFPPGKK